ncbi:sodium-dependent serotonin transporter-like [Diadema antillarum]|uniref:sodium-dependent serotonin transporter-like n=1 Tax=Diadema antillarum TaxID=105358 RepID=UPI003A85B8D1
MDNKAFQVDRHGNSERTKRGKVWPEQAYRPWDVTASSTARLSSARVADDTSLTKGANFATSAAVSSKSTSPGPQSIKLVKMETMETPLCSPSESTSPFQFDHANGGSMTGKNWPQTRKEKQVLVAEIPASDLEPDDSPKHARGNGHCVRVANGKASSGNAVQSPQARQDQDKDQERETWSSKTDFLLSVVGFAVDLGNIWRFPYICYKNGGGAFLIPYTLMAVFGGIPLLYMEMALGQYQRTGCITVWRRICPIMEGLGYAICIMNFFVGLYYSTIIAWAVYYLIASFARTLPWTTCGNPWNTDSCADPFGGNYTNKSVTPATEFFERRVLGFHQSTGIDDVGGVKWDLALCLLLLFIVVFFSILKGIKASGKVVWVTATLPYICLLVLLIRGASLEGSFRGIVFYLTPRWHLLRNANVWGDAAAQVFFSLGPGFGVILAFSSYNKLQNNCFKDAIVVSGINCLTSFFAGFAIFSVLGFMAEQQGKPVEEVTPDGPGLIFIAIPEAISQLPGSTWWAIIFFVMIISLGLDSTFGGLESILTAWCDRNPKVIGKHREIFVALVVSSIFLAALSTVTYGGQYVIELVDHFGGGGTLLFVVILESVSVTWFYGLGNFTNDVRTILGYTPSLYWQLCWRFLSPAMLLFIVVFGIVNSGPLTFAGKPYPPWANGLGWCLTSTAMICVPAFALYKFCITPGTLRQRLVKITRPEEHPDHKVSCASDV